jgi:hypothetical protein
VISAYLSVFDDWRLLGPAMASIEPLVDEIVVVDGAYAWVAPHLPPRRDPSRSDSRVRDALAPFARKTRFVEGVWRHEMEKRMAGFEACRGRYVLKADADEIVFPTEAWSRFFSSGSAVGLTEMLNYLAPGWIEGRPGTTLPDQGVLFDREIISAPEHLSYLWLVHPGEADTVLPPPRPERIFTIPVARNAHLTHWRPPETAVNRARFYVLNLHRRTGRPLAATPLDDQLLRGSIVNEVDTAGEFALRTTPLTREQEAVFAGLYEVYRAELAAHTATLRDWRRVAPGRRGVTKVDRPPVVIDITDPEELTPGGWLRLEFQRPLTYAEARVQTIFTHEPWVVHEPVASAPENGTLTLAIPASDRPWLRRSLRLWFESQEPQLMRIAPA